MSDDAEASTHAPARDRPFVHYCRYSAGYWPERFQRQARKLEQRVRALAHSSGVALGQIGASLASAATRRQSHRRRTMHLATIGSSGSRWPEHMLVEGTGMLGAGEVDLPPNVRRKESASVIQSLHAARPEAFLATDPSTLCVLFLRHPVDLCLSRVYHKDDYRQDIAPEAGAMACLNQNITKVQSSRRRLIVRCTTWC